MATEGMEAVLDPLKSVIDTDSPQVNGLQYATERKAMAAKRTTDASLYALSVSAQILGVVMETDDGCLFTKDLLVGSSSTSLKNAGGVSDGSEAAKHLKIYYTAKVPQIDTANTKYIGTDIFALGLGTFAGTPIEVTNIIKTISDPAAHINKEPGAPSRFTGPSLSAILMTNYSSGINVRGADATSLFCNAVPTLEMSRCVPFTNIIFVTLAKEPGKDTPAEFGIMRFLGMRKDRDDKIGLSAAKIRGIAPGDEEISAALSNIAAQIPFGGEQPSSENPLPVILANGMEMFTSTQTYVNADIGQGYYGGAYVVDKFRPLMSLESISITVTGLDQMMYARERAILKILVHDRSRLQDVAPIIAADKMAMTHVVMEIGWAHPESGDGSTNEYGRFLNNMRQKKIYNIASTTMNIRADGQVSVTVTMAARGQTELISVPTVTGKFVPTALIRPQIEAFAARLASQSVSGGSVGVSSQDILPEQRIGVRNGGTAGSVIERELFDQFLSSVGVIGTATPGEVIPAMKDIITSITDSNKVSKRLTTMKTALKDKKNSMKFVDADPTADPFRDTAITDALKKPTNKDYFSFGKFVMSYVGYPLASSGRFDEVQVLFYPFNAQAGLMHDKNIASFPIPFGEFSDVIDKLEEDSPGTNVTAVFKTIVEKFLKNYSSESYGMSQAYETYDQALKAAKKDDPAALGEASEELNEDLETQLKLIYTGAVGKQATFRPPLIKMYIESFPSLNAQLAPSIDFSLERAEKFKLLEGRSIDRSKIIARIHVFDYHSTPYESELLLTKTINSSKLAAINTGGQASADAVNKALKDMTTTSSGISHYALTEAIRRGLVNVIKTGEADYQVIIPSKQNAAMQIKSIIASGMNNLLFGTEYSALKSAALTSNTSGPANQVILYNAITNKAKDGTQSGTADSLLQDVTVIPGIMNVTMLGCPTLQYGQQFFIDFKTGTTADNVYAATGITHTLRPGEFTTQCAFKFVGAASMSTFSAKIKQLERILEAE